MEKVYFVVWTHYARLGGFDSMVGQTICSTWTTPEAAEAERGRLEAIMELPQKVEARKLLRSRYTLTILEQGVDKPYGVC